MNFTAACLNNSYSAHPAFNSYKGLVCSKVTELICEFCEIYNHKFKNNASVPNSTYHLDAGYKKLLVLSDQLFDQLVKISNERLLKQFFVELKSELIKSLFLDYSVLKKISPSACLQTQSVNLGLLKSQKYFTSKISKESVEKILKLGEASLQLFRQNVALGKLSREDLSFATGPAAFQITEILNTEFLKLGIIDDLKNYFGANFYVSGQAFELSVSKAMWWKNGLHGLSRPPETLYAHLDESRGNPKAIVYLTDVTEKTGPTGCYPSIYDELNPNPLQEIVGRVLANVGNTPNSELQKNYKKTYHQCMTSELFRSHFMSLPKEMRFNSHFGWDIMPGSEAEKILKEREIKVLGPKGTFLVFDGSSLLHRGGMVENGERIALQVIFSLGKTSKFKKSIKKLIYSFR